MPSDTDPRSLESISGAIAKRERGSALTGHSLPFWVKRLVPAPARRWLRRPIPFRKILVISIASGEECPWMLIGAGAVGSQSTATTLRSFWPPINLTFTVGFWQIQDDDYTRRFGGSRVSRSDVLHLTNDNPKATIVADLTRGLAIPDNTFDCIDPHADVTAHL